MEEEESTTTRGAPQFQRLRVRVRYYTDANGTSRQSDLTRRLLFGRTYTEDLPLVCTTHRLRFADIARLPTYRDQVRVFFSASAQTPMRQMDDRARSDADKQTVVQYNFYNMLRLLFPTTLPNQAGVRTSGTHDPPKTAALSYVRSVVPAFSYIYSGAGGGGETKGGGGGALSPLFTNRSGSRRRRFRRATMGGGGFPRSALLSSSNPERTTQRRRRRVRWFDEERAEHDDEAVRGGAAAAALNTEFYTVFRTTWLNDARNHPVYADLINSILRYRAWWLTLRTGNKGGMLDVEKKRFIDQLPRLDASGHLNTALERMRKPDGTAAAALGGLATTFSRNLAELSRLIPRPPAQPNAAAAAAAAAPPPERVPYADRERIVSLMSNLFQLQLDLRENRSVATVVGSDLTMVNLAMQAVQPLLTAFQPVQNLMEAFAAIDSMNTQYKTSLRADVVAYLTRTFPQFVEIMDTLQTFAVTYVSSNAAWQQFFQTILNSTTDVAEVFNAMHVKCVRLSRDEIGADEEALLPLGLDQNIAKKPASSASSSGSDAGNGNTGSSSSSSSSFLATLPVYEAYVQMDLIGFVVGPENVRSVKCGFADFLIGVQFAAITNPPLNDWQVPRRLFYPPAPPSTK